MGRGWVFITKDCRIGNGSKRDILRDARVTSEKNTGSRWGVKSRVRINWDVAKTGTGDWGTGN